MTPNRLFLIFNWAWIIFMWLDIAANEVDFLRDFQKLFDRLRWFFLGGAFFHSILFFTQNL